MKTLMAVVCFWLIAGSAQAMTLMGNTNDYGFTEGDYAVAYLQEKTPFDDAGKEGSFAKGFHAIILWRTAKIDGTDTFDVVCSGADPKLVHYESDKVMPINVRRPVPRGSPLSYLYDVWFTVCRNDTSRY